MVSGAQDGQPGLVLGGIQMDRCARIDAIGPRLPVATRTLAAAVPPGSCLAAQLDPRPARPWQRIDPRVPILKRPLRAAPPPGTVLPGPALDPHIVALTGETLVELLDRAVARNPERDAIVLLRGSTDERWTLPRSSVNVPAGRRRRWRASASHAGDRVVTWGPNDPWLVAAFFAIWRLGAIVVPLDLRMQEAVAERIGARAEPIAGPCRRRTGRRRPGAGRAGRPDRGGRAGSLPWTLRPDASSHRCRPSPRRCPPRSCSRAAPRATPRAWCSATARSSTTRG